MTGLIVLAVILAALVVLSLTTDVLDAFAPVVNSGSAVLAVAFVAGVFVYRWLRNRKKKE
jgi:hypothetical protein